ncbi:MAG: AMIN domain-containing protein [Epulopiscium sp.]|jgi:N-acetylmuramoyl-L-alanine amidase|nr:AMIN domain-containing protein [Candidatus Epulonipiscium sp.]
MTIKKLLASIAVICAFSVDCNVFAGQMVNMRLLYDGKMHNYSAQAIHIKIDNVALETTDMPPIVLNDRTLVPVRAVSEALHAEVAWNQELKEVYIVKDENIVVIQVDNAKGTRNGTVFEMDVAAKIVNERTMIPLRAISEALGCDVQWDAGTRTASIFSKETAPPKDNSTSQNNGASQNNDTSSQNNGASSQGTGISVTNVTLPSANAEETYFIQANGEIAKYETVFVDDKRLVIDIYQAENKLASNIAVNNSPVVSGIRTAQHQVDKNIITRVVFDLKYAAKSNVVKESDTKSLRISFDTSEVPEENNSSTNTTIIADTLKNMSYDSAAQVLSLKKEKRLPIDSIQHTDNYLLKKYSITLPGDYEDDYGYGKYEINNSELNSIQVSTEQGQTKLVFDEKKIKAYTITEDEDYVYIHVQNPKQVYNKIVVLDAGHGGNDPGTSGNGLQEKKLTLQLAQKVYQKLEQNGTIKVYMTRVDDSRPANADRAAMANEIADVFISIHMNSADTPTVKNPLPNGTETLYKVHSTDVEGKLTSKMAATIMQRNVISRLGTNDRGLKHRDDLLVLNATKIPAIIVETVFLSNAGDALKISQENYQNEAAEAIYNAIVEMTNYRLR